MTLSADRGGRRPRGDRTADAWLAEALIREIIVQGHPPGMPLREQEIADRYQVSRPSAREALRLVVQAGFAEIQAFRGARVASVDLVDFLDLLGLLEDSYARCAGLAAERMASARIAQLEGMIPPGLADLPPTTQKGKLYRLSFQVGDFIGQNCGSPTIGRMLRQIGRLVLWQQRLYLPGTTETEAESYHAHRLLVAAIRSRQTDVATGAARSIVLITRRSVHADEAAARARKPNPRRD